MVKSKMKYNTLNWDHGSCNPNLLSEISSINLTKLAIFPRKCNEDGGMEKCAIHIFNQIKSL